MKLSLCIPTRERAEFLAPCLRTVTAVRDASLEIIVSDNASLDSTRAVVEAADDPRIRYVTTGHRVSQRQNFENAVAQASGDYVMVIGDDDAVLAQQWPRLRAILESERPPALSWPALFYHWPAPEKYGGGGRLRLSRATLFGEPVRRDAQRQRQAITDLERTREDFSPKLYHGFLSREVLEALKAKTGQYLMSGQIDAYIAAAALRFMPDYLYIRHPFSMLAMGPKSGGSSVAAQHRAGDANDTAIRVADEAAADPIIEPMAMPFPALGLYLLNGIEQARRQVFDGDLPLNLAAYVGMIGEQLEGLSYTQRERGLALLSGLRENDVSLDAALDALRKRLALVPEPKLAGQKLKHPWIQRIESLSMIEPKRITLDLKPRGLAAVDGAAAMADYLLADAPAAVNAGDAARAWRATLARVARVVLGAKPV
jgi:Glycosyl transferase family 2